VNERRNADADGSPTESLRSGPSDPLLAVDGLTKVFGGEEDGVRAVDDVDFSVDRGTVVGVLGPNGAGKTTVIKSVLGLVVPTSGSIRVNEIDVHENLPKAYNHLGAMLEGTRNVYWRLTVEENLELFAAIAGESPAELEDRHGTLLEQLGLADKADTPVNDLSRGQKQKVALACSLARDAELVFLDEPTLGLDMESSLELRREIRRLADQEDMTIILSSHDMDVVEEVCDRVIVLNDGTIIADDSVSNLLDAFETHAYRVVVDRELPGNVRDRLRETYSAYAFDRYADREEFEMDVGHPDRFYEVMQELHEANVAVNAVESINPDLGEIFYRITNEGTEVTDGDLV
jgi:ABC-2 type transport system ATP-binding protein